MLATDQKLWYTSILEQTVDQYASAG